MLAAPATRTNHGPADLGAVTRAESGTEHHRASAEHHEASHHDLRIPGTLRGQAAELHPGRGVTGLTQRTLHPRHSQQHRTRDTASRRQPGELHRASITLLADPPLPAP